MIIVVTCWCVVLWMAEATVLDPALYLSPSPPLSPAGDTTIYWLQPRFERNADDLSVLPIKIKRKPPASTTTQENIETSAPTYRSCGGILSKNKIIGELQSVQQSTTTERQTTNMEGPTAAFPPFIGHSGKILESMKPTIPTSTTTEAEEFMEKSETFWPRLRTTGQYFGTIHVPLTFSLTGTYGRYGSGNVGVIGSSYGSVAEDTGLSGLYGNYGKSGLAGSSYGSYSGTRIYGGGAGAAWSGWGNGKWGHYGKG